MPVSLQSSPTEATLVVPPFYAAAGEQATAEDHAYPTPLHHIYVKSLLTDAEAARCVALATQHAEITGCWDQPDTARHAAYSTCDFAVEECDALQHYLEEETGFVGRVWEHLSSLYGIAAEDMSFLDFFCAHYQADNDDSNKKNDSSDNAAVSKKTMDRLEAHRDGSLLSFTVTLNDPVAFKGGGTFFSALRDVVVVDSEPVLRAGGVVRPLRAGDGVLHSGKLLHGADAVRSGTRTVLVGFVAVADWLMRPGVLTAACRDWGRMDVATYRWKRQQKMTGRGSGQKTTWLPRSSRWLPRGAHESFLRGVCPAFRSVERRADPEFQRRRKLEAEDLLLRSILLPEWEVPEIGIEDYGFEGDEISIL